MNALILVRHGNTFEADQTPVWVGARTDMSLTAKGEEQAEAVAKFIAEKYPDTSTLLAGPLQRTRRTAEIVGKKIGKPFAIEPALCEIDYGLWEGVSNADIASRYGDAVLEQWEKKGSWPEGMKWQPSQVELQTRLTAFLSAQHRFLMQEKAPRLAVTSNGILRVIHTMITGVQSAPEAKVKTGALCVLQPQGENWRIELWNTRP